MTCISGSCTSDITCTLVQHYNDKEDYSSIMCIIVDCMREGWTYSHNNKHLYCDYIDIDELSEYLDQLCKVNIPNINELWIWSPPTAQCLQYLLHIHTLKILEIISYRLPPLSEDLLYDLVHHHRHTLKEIYINGMTLRSNTRLSTLIPQVSFLMVLGMYGTTMPQQLRTRLEALDSPPGRKVNISNSTILPDTESTD